MSPLDTTLAEVPVQPATTSPDCFQTPAPNSAKARQKAKGADLTCIPINAHYRLAADRYSWSIQRHKRRRHRRTHKLVDDWEPVQWHATLESTIKGLSELMLRTSGVQSLADALRETKRIADTLKNALSPRKKSKLLPRIGGDLCSTQKETGGRSRRR